MPTPTDQRYITVVPAYKAIPNKTEALSLLQLRLLEAQHVTLACPDNLDISAYLDLWPDLRVQRFLPEHFVSIKSYNNFVMDSSFYIPFAAKYEYLLIHQLDAFLLSNQILEFCDLGYDYYGAPWKTGFPQYQFLLNRWPVKINVKRFHVGNGGLSLRKISSTLNLLDRKAGHISKTFFMEDAFFGYWGSVDQEFHACPPLTAAQFSLEMDPQYWIAKTGVLPMGLHGFEVWHQDFYNAQIQKAYTTLFEVFPKIKYLQEPK